jgi:hypothetical protein
MRPFLVALKPCSSFSWNLGASDQLLRAQSWGTPLRIDCTSPAPGSDKFSSWPDYWLDLINLGSWYVCKNTSIRISVTLVFLK